MIKEKTFQKNYKEKILQKYYNTVGTDSAKARSFIKKLNYKHDYYLLGCIALTYFDESFLNDDGDKREYFDMRKLRLAEKYIIRAYTLNEDCIDILYTLGKIRNAFKQTDMAIYCYRRIIEIGLKKIPKKDISTDRSFVQMLVNDSKFQLYRLYYDRGDFLLSKKYLAMYKIGLKRGIKTIYKPLKNFLMN
jgi:tetratricopeptide (TPR) repeat protein